VRFTVLGSGTTVPDADRGPAGFLVAAHGATFLVDGGSGTLQRCTRAGVDPRTLDGGVYSHHHPDHCSDLVPLLFSMRVGPPARSRDYPIWAGEGFAVFYTGLLHAYGKWMQPGTGTVELHELTLLGPSLVELHPGLSLRTAPAVHHASALHLRFESEGRSVTFSGDTAWSDALVELAAGTDLLVCECAGADDDPVEGHLTPSEVRRLAEAARPREVWLTHLYPGVDPATAVATVAASGVGTRHARDLDVWESTALPELTAES
jgi:ribonuclease BN (tRNA processing enzyme)